MATTVDIGISPFVWPDSLETGHVAPVGPSMAEKHVGAAIRTTSVETAEGPIQRSGIRNPPKLVHHVSPSLVKCPPNRQVHKQSLPTPIRANKLHQFLKSASYPEHLTRNLVKGFEKGLSLGYQGPRDGSSEAKNLKSRNSAPEIVQNKLDKEIAKGRISAGYDIPPYSNFICSPIGLVPKKVHGEFRLIHHLSFPKGASVNDGIPEDRSSVSYATLDEAIKEIRNLGKKAFIAKSDKESAFRLIPIRKEDYHLLGFQWKDQYYFERVLPMGCASSCQLFESFSTALEYLVKHYTGSHKVLHVLDDFLFIGNDKAKCQYLLDTFLNICKEIGVPIAQDKSLGPVSKLSFLGIELDCEAQEARLPEEKLIKSKAS